MAKDEALTEYFKLHEMINQEAMKQVLALRKENAALKATIAAFPADYYWLQERIVMLELRLASMTPTSAQPGAGDRD